MDRHLDWLVVNFGSGAARRECRGSGLDPPGARIDLGFGGAAPASDQAKSLKQKMLATKAAGNYPPVMSLKSAATFAFIGTLLAAALLIYYFVFDIINVADGLIPLVKLFPSFIYALAALSLTVFFYVFQKHN
jgi:hypothetical protein